MANSYIINLMSKLEIWWLKRELRKKYRAVQGITRAGDGGNHITMIIRGESYNRSIRSFNETLRRLKDLDPEARDLPYIPEQK